jgi:RimJ/RimL family protein N-acetyltransferase
MADPNFDISLRNVTEADLPIFFEQQLEPEAGRMAAFPARDRETFMEHWTRILGDETITKKTIVVDGQVAGNIVSFQQLGEPQVGYWLGKAYWGRGIATHALAAFLEQVKRRPLYAHVAKHNIASIRVLEKCGFRICGEEKGFPDTDGNEVEEVILALNES